MKLIFLSFFFYTFAQAQVTLTEQTAVEMFLKNNLNLMASKAEIDFATAQELTAGLFRNPSLFMDSQLNPFGQNWNQKNAGGPTQRDLILTVPIDVNGKRRQAVKVAKLATKVAEAFFQETVRSKVFELLNNLYSLQRLHKELELLTEKRDLLEKSVQTLQKRVGSSQPLIQNRAKLALEEVRFIILDKKAELHTVENDIRSELMLSAAERLKVQVKFLTEVKITETAQELLEKARRQRPDFVGLSLLKEQLAGDVELQKRRVFDDVQLQGGLTRQSAVGARPGDPNSNSLPGAWSWIVGLTVPIPVFDRNQGNIMASKVRQNQVSFKEMQLVVATLNNLDSSLERIFIIGSKLKSFRHLHLDSAQAVRDSALRQFGTGSTTLIEYLDAVNAYQTAIGNYINTQYSYTVEYLNLKLQSGDSI